MDDNSVLHEIFKAYDVRGKVGSQLNTNTVYAIARAFADWLPDDGVVAIGHDMRPDSAELSEAIVRGLQEQGRDVWDIGEVTSDMIYFAVGHFDLAGGVMITASHNPGEYNGIKFCREQAKPVGEESGLFEIRDIAIRNRFNSASKQGIVNQKDVTNDWISHVLSFIDVGSLRRLTISVDAGNGMAGKIFPAIEKHLPFKVNELYFELDGSFPNHIANPLEPKNLVDLQKSIQQTGGDCGVAFDGDGDRAVLVDENGIPLSGTVMTALLAEYFLKNFPGATILYNAICGRAAIETIEAYGGKSVRTRVGHSFIKADMRKYDAVFAGEHSGHYYFRDNFMADSGLIAAIVALSILSGSGKTLSQLVAPYRDLYAQISEANFEVKDKSSVINSVAAAFANEQQDTLDGLTINFPYGWFNVRPSNTEPLLRLNAEAKSQQQLDELVAKVTKIITQ